MWTNREDPVMTCQPMGIPRQGPPGRIFHTDNDVTLIYGRGGDGGGGYPDFRVIATDDRPFDEKALLQVKYTGHSVGRWEGDTLVIESRGFSPQTWLARGGFFHTDEMRVFERFTRQGDELMYEVTVEDPTLLQPWKQNPMLMTKAADSGAEPGNPTLIGAERGHCEAYEELSEIENQIRH
jgi:hypothetical protein